MKGIRESSIFLRVLIPPMLDTARITARTIVTKTNEKTIPFPTMAELTSRILTDELIKRGELNIVSDATVAEIQVESLFDLRKVENFFQICFLYAVHNLIILDSLFSRL